MTFLARPHGIRLSAISAACACWGFAAFLGGCECGSTEAPQDSAVAAGNSSQASQGPATPQEKRPLESPKTLLQWGESAYGVQLAFDGDAVLLLTQTGVIRIESPGSAKKMNLELGVGATAQGDSIFYYNSGALRQVAKRGGEPQPVASVQQPPQLILGSERGLVWLMHNENGSYEFFSLAEKESRSIYKSTAYIAAAQLQADILYFVEGLPGNEFRIGALSVREGKQHFSRIHQGRTPSMLASDADGVHFYDGPTRSLIRLSADLSVETVLATQLICSPLAVSAAGAICAQVGGLVAVQNAESAPRLLALETKGPVATLAINAHRVFWLTDVGENRLAVRSIAHHPVDPTPSTPIREKDDLVHP